MAFSERNPPLPDKPKVSGRASEAVRNGSTSRWRFSPVKLALVAAGLLYAAVRGEGVAQTMPASVAAPSVPPMPPVDEPSAFADVPQTFLPATYLSPGTAASFEAPEPGAAGNPTAKATPPQQKRARSKPPVILQQLMKMLRQEGIKTVFVGEYHHGAPHNADLASAVLEGSLLAGPGIQAYRELNVPPDHFLDADAAMADPATREWAVNISLVSMGNKKNFHDKPTGAGGRRFVRAMSDPGVTPRHLGFRRTDRSDMERLLSDKRFSVAMLGLAHSSGEIIATNRIKMPGTNEAWDICSDQVDPLQCSPPMPQNLQRANFNGFARAGKNAALVVQTEAFVHKGISQGPFLSEYNRRGYVIMGVPLGEGLTAYVIGPANKLRAFERFADLHHDKGVSINCDGIPGCLSDPARREL